MFNVVVIPSTAGTHSLNGVSQVGAGCADEGVEVVGMVGPRKNSDPRLKATKHSFGRILDFGRPKEFFCKLLASC
jgi:hypothetical protein